MDSSKILSATDQTITRKSGIIGFLIYASKCLEIAKVKVVDQYGKLLASARILPPNLLSCPIARRCKDVRLGLTIGGLTIANIHSKFLI